MTGLRERQKAGRRRDILAAAAKLFRRDGFAVTSIEAIAAEADVPGEDIRDRVLVWTVARPVDRADILGTHLS